MNASDARHFFLKEFFLCETVLSITGTSSCKISEESVIITLQNYIVTNPVSMAVFAGKFAVNSATAKDRQGNGSMLHAAADAV